MASLTPRIQATQQSGEFETGKYAFRSQASVAPAKSARAGVAFLRRLRGSKSTSLEYERRARPMEQLTNHRLKQARLASVTMAASSPPSLSEMADAAMLGAIFVTHRLIEDLSRLRHSFTPGPERDIQPDGDL